MNLTYVLGAGASANALPIVRNMDDRIGIFIDHLKDFGLRSSEQGGRLDHIYGEIKKHYTIDTYAKKLFLKGRTAEKELLGLYNFMGAYFIYEQLRKEPDETTCSYLFNKAVNFGNTAARHKSYRSVIESVDYRYDSFYAALLNSDNDGNVYLPPNVNIISWNYDFQLEISFMNFIDGCDIDEIQKKLNVYPRPDGADIMNGSSIVKINGTAGFFREDKSYKDLFDFRCHSLNNESMQIINGILFQDRADAKNLINFAWNHNVVTKKARSCAREIIKNTDILVVVGYSFPYFNRDIDRDIFSLSNRVRGGKVYIQTSEDTLDSVKDRAKGVNEIFKTSEGFTELDQFLIPNEL